MRFPRWLVSSILAFQFLLSTLQLLDVHRVWYFPMIHGLAYSLRFDLGFNLFPAILPVSAVAVFYLLKGGKYREVLLAALLSLFVYVFLGLEAAVSWFSFFQIPLALVWFVDVGDFLYSLLVVLTGFEVVALVHWMLLPLGISTPLVWFADLEMALFYVFAPLAPLVVLTIFLVVFFKLFFPKYLVSVERFLKGYKLLKGRSTDVNINLDPKLFLGLSLIFSVVGALYPYSRYINPDGIVFGVDVHYYVDWIGSMTQDFYSAFTIANGSRPVVLWLIYGIHCISGLRLIETIKFLPVLLNPLLVLSIYSMVFQATKDKEWAVLASFYTALGFTTTVGMYSYYLANILALVLIYSAIGFLFNSLKTGRRFYLILSCILGSLTTFTHPWTFYQYYIILLFTAIYVNRINFEEHYHNISYTFIFFLLMTLTIEIIKNNLNAGINISNFMNAIIPHIIGISNFWDSNIFAFRQRFGGLLSNVFLFCLVTFCSFKLNNKKFFHLFLNLIIFISSIFYIFADGVFQTRLLFNIPFGIFSSFYILSLLRNKIVNVNIRFIGLIFTVTYMILYMIRSLANLI